MSDKAKSCLNCIHVKVCLIYYELTLTLCRLLGGKAPKEVSVGFIANSVAKFLPEVCSCYREVDEG